MNAARESSGRAVLLALFLDAYYQVVDNRVFRILMFVVGAAVALSFVLGAGEERLSLLWFSLDYGQFQLPTAPGAGRRALLDGIAGALVNPLTGSAFLVVGITACASFVPRTLERGSAEILFSKPVARGVLLLSRYAAGLLLVGALTTALVVGTYAGLALRSGLADPAFLWALPVLLYRFAVMYAFAVLVGVWLKSAAASILLTLLVAGGTGCVHMAQEVRAIAQAEAQSREQRELERGREVRRDPESPTLALVFRALELAHFALPKPGDGARIAQLLSQGDPRALDAAERERLLRENEDREKRGLRPRPLPTPPARDPRLAFGGPWQNNAWVSLGTTGAFWILCLSLAVLRLRRMPF